MRAWKTYGAAVALLLFLASGKLPGTDVARLEPVEAVQICREEGRTVIRTDTGQWGKGKSLKEALEDMKQTASKEVFLETAVWLMIDPASVEDLTELETMIRPNCRLCLYTGRDELSEAAAFLNQQKLTFLLRQWREGKIPSLYKREGRLYLDKGESG